MTIVWGRLQSKDSARAGERAQQKLTWAGAETARLELAVLGTITCPWRCGIDWRRYESEKCRFELWGESVTCSTRFIEERIVLVRSLAEKADPFIKPRLLALAGRYERQFLPKGPSQAVREIKMAPTLPVWVSSGER